MELNFTKKNFMYLDLRRQAQHLRFLTFALLYRFHKEIQFPAVHSKPYRR